MPAGLIPIGHDLSGRLAGVLFPSDALGIYDFDASCRLSSITHRAPAAAVLASFTMGYDAAGNITSITDGQPARVCECRRTG